MWAAHLDDERVLKHGIPHDPQPLVLHARPDVGHSQGPPWGRADLADRAARRLLLLLSQEVLAGAPGLRHPGGAGRAPEGWSRRASQRGGWRRAPRRPTTRPDRTTRTPGGHPTPDAPRSGVPQPRPPGRAREPERPMEGPGVPQSGSGAPRCALGKERKSTPPFEEKMTRPVSMATGRQRVWPCAGSGFIPESWRPSKCSGQSFLRQT